jgi:hypothetical protein
LGEIAHLLVTEYKEKPSNKHETNLSISSIVVKFVGDFNIRSQAIDNLIHIIEYDDSLDHRLGEAIFARKELSQFSLTKILLHLCRNGNQNLYHEVLSKRSDLPVEILEDLIQKSLPPESCEFPTSYHHYISNSNISTALLERLANCDSNKIRESVAKNPNTPIPILDMLASSNEDSVYYPHSIHLAVARNPSTSASILRILASYSYTDILCAVAKNPNTPIDLLLTFATHPNEQLRAEVAQNKHLPLDILKTLSKDQSLYVRVGIVSSIYTPLDISQGIIDDMELFEQSSIYMSSDIHSQLLERLFDNPSPAIRSRLVRHANTPTHTLVKLAEEDDIRIRHTFHERGVNIPEIVLKTLAKTTFAAIARLKNDPNNVRFNDAVYGFEIMILYLLLSHPNTSSVILEMFVNNQSIDLHQIIGSELHRLHYFVASNINTPTCILEKLLSDYYEFDLDDRHMRLSVSKAARDNLRLR